ncbi:metalloprotease family protein [Prochlorococcus sp. AH-736-K20]|nr:metalloprotease family protein [Prochlorococcus sp. AH-736-K20]MDA9745948.1 metalloprotease family protein [Prochlorococcus sp. AH-736-K20]
MKSILRSIFYMPGVITHELSHHIFCIIFNAKVIKVCYYNFKDSSGYVRHERPKHLYQDVLIAVAPFFLNTFLGGLIAYPTIIYKLGTLGLLSLNWRDISILMISISVGMHAIPSKGDALSMWNFVSESDMNFLLKISSKLIIAPLVLVVFLLNFLSSFLKIDLFYGICVCFFGPRIIEYIINIGIIREFINGIESAW